MQDVVGSNVYIDEGMCYESDDDTKREDWVPIKVSSTGGGGLARVWGHVKMITHSAREKLKALVSNES